MEVDPSQLIVSYLHENGIKATNRPVHPGLIVFVANEGWRYVDVEDHLVTIDKFKGDLHDPACLQRLTEYLWKLGA